jgi:hypothetical protein
LISIKNNQRKHKIEIRELEEKLSAMFNTGATRSISSGQTRISHMVLSCRSCRIKGAA